MKHTVIPVEMVHKDRRFEIGQAIIDTEKMEKEGHVGIGDGRDLLKVVASHFTIGPKRLPNAGGRIPVTVPGERTLEAVIMIQEGKVVLIFEDDDLARTLHDLARDNKLVGLDLGYMAALACNPQEL